MDDAEFSSSSLDVLLPSIVASRPRCAGVTVDIELPLRAGSMCCRSSSDSSSSVGEFFPPSRLDPGLTEGLPKPVQLGFVDHGHPGSCARPSSSMLRGGGKGGGGVGSRTALGIGMGAAAVEKEGYEGERRDGLWQR